MDLRTAYSKAQGDLANAERKLADLARRVEELKVEKRGLELAMARNGEAPHPDTSAADAVNDWNRLSRTDAIVRVMEGIGNDELLSPQDVLDLLRKTGRSDSNAHAVSSALSYLRQQGKVRSEGRGRWALAAPAVALPSSVESSDEPPPGEPPPEDEELDGDDVSWWPEEVDG